MDASAHFKGKRITVMGLGLLGRGLGDIRYLAAQGAELTVTDLKTAEQLATSLEALEDFSSITYVLGEHRLEDFCDRDYILKAAGVPFDSPYIAEARKHNIPVKMSASWFAEIAQILVIGVTGTRGKSTTTHMIESILKRAGFPVLVGGNVRGVSTLALLPEVDEVSVALLELDSWQLQGFGDAHMSPNVAVFTTFFPDHLNYYKGDLDTYLDDKAQIFLHQEPTDTLVVGSQCADLIQEKYGDSIRAHVVTVGAHDFRADWELKLPGEHNRYDAALAVESARALNIDDETIKEALADFSGVPGRLYFVRELNGIKIYDDNNSTTPEAVIAAIRAVGPKAVLIMGGDDKNLDMSELVREIPNWCTKVVLFKERGTDRIRDEVFALQEKGIDVYEEEGLSATVARAYEIAAPGENIVFSPGFSSFGKYFKNEYDRGDQFNALIAAL